VVKLVSASSTKIKVLVVLGLGLVGFGSKLILQKEEDGVKKNPSKKEAENKYNKI